MSAHVDCWIEIISFNKVSNHSKQMKRTTTSESWLKKWKSSFLLFLDHSLRFISFLLLSLSFVWQTPSLLSVFLLLLFLLCLLLLPSRTVHTSYSKRLSFSFFFAMNLRLFYFEEKNKKIIIIIFVCFVKKTYLVFLPNNHLPSLLPWFDLYP